MGQRSKVWKQSIAVVMVFNLIMGVFAFSPSSAQAADQYDAMRLKWYSYLTGGTYNTADSDIAAKITKVTDDAQGFWSTMNKSGSRTYIWSDLSPKSTTSNIRETYARLNAMTLAYKTVGSTLNNNASLLSDIVSALDWLNSNNWYSSSITVPTGAQTVANNWYDWEIGVPLVLNNIAVLLYDNLTSTQLNNYMNAIDHFVSDCSIGSSSVGTGVGKATTGANLAWKCSAQILRGVIVKNSSVIADGQSKITRYLIILLQLLQRPTVAFSRMDLTSSTLSLLIQVAMDWAY